MKKLLFSLLILSVFSCTDELKKEDQIQSYETSVRNAGLGDFSTELENFWSASYQEYPRQTFCNCDNGSMAAAKDVFTIHNNKLPSSLQSSPITCSADFLYGKYKEDYCSMDKEAHLSLTISTLRNNSFSSTEETDLLIDMMAEVRAGTFDENFVTRWENLGTVSNHNNAFSLTLIESTLAVVSFHERTDIFDDTVEGLWVHITRGVISAGATALSLCAEDSVSNNNMTTASLVKNSGRAFILGALTAL